MPSTPRSQMQTLVLLISLALAGSAHATPQQSCQATKNKTAGKYVACRHNAEAKLATSGDMTRYTSALAKCETKFTSAWNRASAKAIAVGATCLDDPLTVGDFQGVIAAHTDNVATALGGGGLTDCPTDLATCGDDRDACQDDLATCEADIMDAQNDLDDCQTDLAACQAQPTGRILKTGQTTSYGSGSDGDLQLGVARSFTDNGDGTITDNATGLMWEKKSDDNSIHDKDNTYSWSTGTNNLDSTIVTFLAALNGGGGFAGHTDWRLPNRFELESLLNLEMVSPPTFAAFNNACGGGCTVTTCSCTAQSSYYFSSSTYQGSPPSVWGVYFSDGDTLAIGKQTSSFVRAVRAGT